MNFQIILLILCLHYCTSQLPGALKKTVKSYPKKVRVGLTLYNNAGKYSKIITRTTKTKKPFSENEYTVFAKPFIITNDAGRHQIVPDSPYFPVDEPKQHERRSRVKKVLPDYVLPVRRKRDVDEKVSVTAQITKDLTPSASSPTVGKTESDIKQLLTSVSKTVNTETKTSKAPIKKSTGKKNRLRASKKRGRTNRSSKKKAGTRNLKSKDPRNKKSQRLAKSRLARSKKLKSSKKLRDSNQASRNLKSSRLQRQKLRNKNVKRLPQGDNPSKLKAAKNHKGDTRRLIAGRDAMIEDYPYTISIQKDHQHWCSGAILNPRLIITTANCLWKSSVLSRMRVRAGSRYADYGGQVAKIQEVMKHPGWKIRKNPDNDIALAVLDRNIGFSHGLHGVDLPNKAMLPPFDDVWVTSWGAERRDGIYDKGMSLQVYHGRLMELQKCNNITKRFAVEVTENFICLSQAGTRAPCTRDTGAPAVSDGVLWGLASWGLRKLWWRRAIAGTCVILVIGCCLRDAICSRYTHKCGTERFPAMYSYTASPSNIDFITNATHYLMADERLSPYLDRYPMPRIPSTDGP